MSIKVDSFHCSIMAQTDLLPTRKRPFVRFFLQVYMKEGGSKQASEVNHGK